jgi:hypothetical protein
VTAQIFERGMIVARANDKTWVVYGAVYLRYRALGDLGGVVGLPSSDEGPLNPGGRISHFDNGDILWRGDVQAHEVHGAIRDRYYAMGGAASGLGYPLTDESPVLAPGGAEIGRYNRFQGGTIYWSGGTGAWDVYGAIRDCWENEWAGAAGALGLPTSGETSTPSSGGRYNNFERGIIVWHPSGANAGAIAITSVSFWLERFDTFGDDAWGAQDLYVKADVRSSYGQRFNERMPHDGDMGSSPTIQRQLWDVPVVHSDLTIDVHFDCWDSDDTSGDDQLGVIDRHYSVDNVWGVRGIGDQREGDALANFAIRNPMPFDPTRFRQQLWWGFHNFDTAELSWQEYAETFRDVSNDETTVWHPFDHLFYSLVYEGIAAHGNCFGMCLESIYAQVGRSSFAEPLHRWPEQGQEHEEVNIKHGYQVGAEFIDWFLGQFIAGNTHNPKNVFYASRDSWARGDYPIISLTKDTMGKDGHAVRPYRWHEGDHPAYPGQLVINVANPNHPDTGGGDDDAIGNLIRIDPGSNTFRFESGDSYTGGEWSGGRMLSVPFSVLCTDPRTPFWEVFALLAAATLIILGDGGQTSQITDAQGRTFYAPDLAAPPTNWSDIQRDAQLRIPNMARIPLINRTQRTIPASERLTRIPGFDSTRVPPIHLKTPPEVYLLRGDMGSVRQEVIANAGYSWTMRSAVLSAHVEAASAQGRTDTVTVEGAGTDRPLVSLSATAALPATLTIAGPSGVPTGQPTKSWIVQGLTLAPGQTLRARLDDTGQALLLQHAGDGPAAAFSVRAQAGGDAQTAATQAGITISPGQTMRFAPTDWALSSPAARTLRADVVPGP